MKKKLMIIVLVLMLTSCGSMKLATNSGYSLNPQVKTEKQIKNTKRDKIVVGVIVFIAVLIGDFTKVI